MRTTLLILLVADMACGNDIGSKTIDAPGAGGDAAVDGSPIDGPGKALTCTYYCATIQSACSGTVQQYAAAADCMNTCAKFTPGMLDQTMGDTLGCRIRHAEQAMTNAATYCVQAGPTGGGVCGVATPNYCGVFCPLEEAICPGAYPATGNGRCLGNAGCPSITSTPPYSANDTNKNDLECRFYHLTEAATNPSAHCGHTIVASPICNQ
jgi:hypothetical protein